MSCRYTSKGMAAADGSAGIVGCRGGGGLGRICRPVGPEEGLKEMKATGGSYDGGTYAGRIRAGGRDGAGVSFGLSVGQ